MIPREPGQEPLPPQLVAILVAGRAGPTWDRYVPAFRDWQQFATALGFIVLPAKPAEFLRFLAARAESDAGHSQTKMRICAIDAASQLAGVPSPSSDPTIGAFRRGIRRVKHAARGPVRPMFRSEIPAPEMPPDAGPSLPAPDRLSRRGLSAMETARARAAAGRHLMLLSDATARYDDLNEGQLGDVLFEDNRTVIAVFGSKCDRGGAGKPVALPAASEEGSGAYLLADSVRRAMTRLLAAPPEVLGALARNFTAAGRDRLPPGPRALATWPADVQALALRLYAAGIPAHRLPIFGPWLFRDATPALQLAGALTTREFRALAARTVREAGGDAANFGTHSARRGAAAALFHAGVPRPLVTQALRHASARSDEPYILESAKLTAVATAPRMPPPGRSAGAAGAPRGGVPPHRGPPTAVPRLHPAGASQPGGPLAARVAPGVAPLVAAAAAGGWPAQRATAGPGIRAPAHGRGHRGRVPPLVRAPARGGPDRP